MRMCKHEWEPILNIDEVIEEAGETLDFDALYNVGITLGLTCRKCRKVIAGSTYLKMM